MGKKSRRKNKQKSKLKPTITNQKSPQESPRKKYIFFLSAFYRQWGFVWGILGPIIAIAAFYYAFYPSISLKPGDQIFKKNSFSIPFVVSNNNIFPIRNVRFDFYIYNLNAIDTNRNTINIKEIGLRSVPSIPIISPHSESAAFLKAGDIFGYQRIIDGDISVEISFDPPWFYPSKRKLVQRYSAYSKDDGKIYWMPTTKIQ